MTEHKPAQFYWEAGSEECPHAPQPDYRTDGEAWDIWRERHPSSADGPICLEAPAGEACPACSSEHGDMVPWSLCAARTHARPKAGVVPTPGAEHQPVTVLVGTLECLDRECEEYFTDDGDEIPGMEICSHIREEDVCSCQRSADDEYGDATCPARSLATSGGTAR